MGGLRAIAAVTLIVMLALTAMAMSQESFGFMPSSAKAFLPRLAATADDLRKLAAEQHSEADWRQFVTKSAPGLAEREIGELAAYLAINMPATTPLPAGADRAALVDAFPADGRELAWNHCQSCHSLFTGYLMQNRDVQGWRSVFLSPFHRNIRMNDKERETFARYSAASMPMKAEDVPADLRF